jgi:class 3 adenylate cyclase
MAALIPGATLVEVPPDAPRLEEQRATWEFLGIPGFSEPAESSGHVTASILFADIADSTALTERLGDAVFRSRARELDSRLRAIIREHRGTPVDGKLVGDGVLATFNSARDAVTAGLAISRAGSDAGLALHAGVHAGDVLRERDNVYGGAVNVAARIADAAGAGEVLVSDVVRVLARTSLPESVRFDDRGDHALRGVSEAHRLYAVESGRPKA